MKKKLISVCWLVMILSVLSGIVCLAATRDLKVEITYEQTSARNMLDLINEFRKGTEAWAWNATDTEKVQYTGLGDLVYDGELEKVAMQRAAEIAILYSHTRPDDSDCFSAGGWGTSSSVYGFSCGENIAAGQTSAQQVFISWREDDDPYAGQGHRRNMLGGEYGFTSIGIGHVIYNGIHYWVQEFGTMDHGVSTEAANETVVETIPVEETLVSRIGAGQEVPSGLEVYYGKTVSLPELTPTFDIDSTALNIHGNSYLDYNKPLAQEYVWSVSGSDIISLSGKQVKGLKAGSAVLIAKTPDDTVRVTVKVKQVPLSSVIKIGQIEKQYYTGKALTPKYSVTRSDKTFPMPSAADYTVSWSNNVKTGTATLKLTGKGNYTGTVSKTFKIVYRPKKTQFKGKTGIYRITKTGLSGMAEVEYAGPVNKSASEQKIPATVRYQLVSYKVTSVAANALRGNVSVRKLTIGRNVKKIGTRAFYNCSRLRTVSVLTKKLTESSIGKYAFRGTHKKAGYLVPATKLKKYRTWFLKAGAAKTSTFTAK